MVKYEKMKTNNGAPDWLKKAYKESAKREVRYKPIVTLEPLAPDHGSKKWFELGLFTPLGEIAAKITGSEYPYIHQQKTIESLLSEETKQRPIILKGGTGSGKSLAFLLPAISLILQGTIDFAVVFYPMKQLIEDQFHNLKKILNAIYKKTGKVITAKTYHGEQGLDDEEKVAWEKELLETEDHPPNILLATFDKVYYQLMHCQEKKCQLHKKIMTAPYLVFDEIHAMKGLPASYIHYFIQSHKLKTDCRIVLSTATIAEAERFAQKFLQPKMESTEKLDITIIESNPVRGTIHVRAIMMESFLPLLSMVEKELPEGTVAFVFVDSKRKIEEYASKLGLKLHKDQAIYDSGKICVLHANLHQKIRKQALIDVRAGKVKFVITSAVSELGLDLNNIATIINVGWPVSGKDGLLQRIARDRSKPGERKAAYLVFDLENPRDKLYYSNLSIIKEILEEYQCTPIRYPERNQKVITTTIILQLVYGNKNYSNIISFFGPELRETVEKCITVLLSHAIIQKNGQILSLVETNTKAYKKLIASSIRAIAKNWVVIFQGGELRRTLGFLSQDEVLRGGMRRNILLLNKIPYLVTKFDKKKKEISVVLATLPKKELYIPGNVLAPPSFRMGLYSKKKRVTSGLEFQLGEIIVAKNPKLISTCSPNNKNYFQLLPVEGSEIISNTLEEKSFGFLVDIARIFQDPLLSHISAKTKELLACLSLVLKTQIELTLQIPQSEIVVAYNEHQFVVFDKGGENGNVQHVFKELSTVIKLAINRLDECNCLDGCEKCFGRDFTKQLPFGKSKIIIKQALAWLQE